MLRESRHSMEVNLSCLYHVRIRRMKFKVYIDNVEKTKENYKLYRITRKPNYLQNYYVRYVFFYNNAENVRCCGNMNVVSKPHSTPRSPKQGS